MRVVLDTNVLVSAALKDQSLPALAVRLVQQRGTLLKSTTTEAQFHAVLARPYLARLISPVSPSWLNDLMASAELVSITGRVAVCRDPTDDKFLDLAVNGEADAVVSGDADLLVLKVVREIPIMSPVAFVQLRHPGFDT